MAPYQFNAPDVDTILRSSDEKEFRVHKVILSLASPIFQSMFSLPQATESPSQIPTIDVSEPSDILEPFIQYLYPLSPPNISDVEMWAALYAVADKYNAEVVVKTLRDMLIPRFLETSPVRVYAWASHLGFEEEAKIASRGTLKIDISKGFPEDDGRLMGSVACQKLYHLHLQRRDKARALITSRTTQFSGNCRCPPINFAPVIQALIQRVSATPWLTLEELYEETSRDSNVCYVGCRNNLHARFCSLLEGMSELPETI